MPENTNVLGLDLIGSGAFDSDMRPLHWRAKMLELWPNGEVSLTALTALMESEQVDDYQWNWWEKGLPAMGGSLTGVFLDPGMAIPYDANNALPAGSLVHVKVTQAVSEEFYPGVQAVLAHTDNARHDLNVKVVEVVRNGADSRIVCRLLERDGRNGGTLSGADLITRISNLNAQGAEMPRNVAYRPVKRTNKSQIWRNSLAMTRTARRIKTRTPETYKALKKEALLLHGLDIENALMFSAQSEVIGENGEPETSTEGLLTTIQELAPQNVFDFRYDADFTGKTWKEAGWDFLNKAFEVIFNYGNEEKIAFYGNGAAGGITTLARYGAQISITPQTRQFGLKIREWESDYGTLQMKRYPGFNRHGQHRNTMLIFEPRLCKFRYVDDTEFYKDDRDAQNRAGYRRIDGIFEEYLTEGGVELWHPSAHGIILGVGEDNLLIEEGN